MTSLDGFVYGEGAMDTFIGLGVSSQGEGSKDSTHKPIRKTKVEPWVGGLDRCTKL
jgi:hypothetical protein